MMAGMPCCIPPASKPYFHGGITRDQAETALKRAGLEEGMFLLRESLNKPGSYALSICCLGGVLHYSIEKQLDGTVMIENGKKFPGPVELIEHHQEDLDGLAIRPSKPCRLPDGQSPMVWPGVTMLELDKTLMEYAKAKNILGRQLSEALGPQRKKLISMVAKELHVKQPWFHDNISRGEAEKTLRESGCEDGKFLVRTNDKGEFAVCLSYQDFVKHYKIQRHGDRGYGIEDGPIFENIMDLVGHYHNKADGMSCKLSVPCPKPRYQPNTIGASSNNPIYIRKRRKGSAVTLPLPNPEPINTDLGLEDEGWDPPDVVAPRVSVEIAQEDYDNLPEVTRIAPRDLELQDTLGTGCFGNVKKGIFKSGNQRVHVAVKCLRKELPGEQEDLLSEARAMSGLRHGHIVRMIGVCLGTNIMLVLELAPLGPLNSYLKKNTNLPVENVLRLLYQVALGMEYLESKSFIHRDLAARNVLLVTDSFAKISDFGMSRALGLDSVYYKASNAIRWPLKWYALECIYYWKFDLKSDVWSYGITMWEALSYGQKPYQGLSQDRMIRMLERGDRLSRPDRCPAFAYDVMKSCWHVDQNERPTFVELASLMKRYY